MAAVLHERDILEPSGTCHSAQGSQFIESAQSAGLCDVGVPNRSRFDYIVCIGHVTPRSSYHHSAHLEFYC